MSGRRIMSLIGKEWRELLRDRIFCALAFVLPPMMMLIFGYGMTQDVENVPFAILDYDHSKLSREFSQHFISSRFFRFRGYLTASRDIDHLVRAGEIRFALVIPEKFQQRLYAGQSTGIQTILDGTFIVSIRSARGYVNAVASAAGAAMQAEYISAHAGIPMERAQALMTPLKLETRYLYNQPLRTVWGIAPLLIMMILMWVGPMLMSLSVVREKESGAIYNIYASTITRSEFLIGKLTPIIGVSYFNAVVLWIMAVGYYGAPFRGSLSCFVVAALFFVIGVCGLGLLLSVVVKTQNAALMVSIILGSMIASQYSGINVPISDMTGATYVIAHLFPAMYFTDVVEAVFLRGGGWAQIGVEVGVLAAYGAAAFGLGCVLFHKRVPA